MLQVKTWLWDSNTAFTTVLDNPTAYGFVDAVSYGGTNDFWGNNYHPSSAFAEFLITLVHRLRSLSHHRL